MAVTKKKQKRSSSARQVAGANADQRRRAGLIYRALVRLYPEADCALQHDGAWQLLVSTILSAQCTDVRVNMVTPSLFAAYGDPASLARASLPRIEKLIQTTGFYRNKAKSIKGSAQMVADKFAGQVPDEMDKLLTLPGVARKTANVVLGNAFGKNIGVVVDTHVGRLSLRLGLTGHKDPKKVEQDLMPLFARKNWTMLAHLLIYHGRAVCKARNPQCGQCKLRKDCPQIGVTKK
jgi:endonuclease-3